MPSDDLEISVSLKRDVKAAIIFNDTAGLGAHFLVLYRSVIRHSYEQVLGCQVVKTTPQQGRFNSQAISKHFLITSVQL